MTEKLRTYSSDSIEVTYDIRRCIHAAECVRTLPAVFDPDKRPWIDPSAAGASEIVDAVLRCPTGALRYARKDGGAAESIADSNVVTVDIDGPLYAHGNLELRNADGSTRIEARMALCRCGLSANKPFCDNSHVSKFTDSGPLGAQANPTEGTPGPLKLTSAPNGPLLFTGLLEIRSADGSQTLRTAKGALCRCGASQNKPFCDGSHKSIGFQSAE